MAGNFITAQAGKEPMRMPWLKPELLPDEEKLQLSQIRPLGALPLENHEPQYSGYSFLEDGRYAAGVWLCNEKEAMEYVEMQKSYQHRIMLCDRNDFCVWEVRDGRQVGSNAPGIGRQSGTNADVRRELRFSTLSGPWFCQVCCMFLSNVCWFL